MTPLPVAYISTLWFQLLHQQIDTLTGYDQEKMEEKTQLLVFTKTLKGDQLLSKGCLGHASSDRSTGGVPGQHSF